MSEILSVEEFYHRLFEAMNAQYGDVEQKTIGVIKDRDNAICEKYKEAIDSCGWANHDNIDGLKNAIDSVFDEINKE